MFSIFELMQQVQQCGVHLFLDERGAHALPADRLPRKLREELRKHKSEVIDYLTEQGETIVADADAVITNRVEPAPELTAAQKLAAQVKAAPRYQNGAVLINSVEGARFGGYVRQLVKMREQRETAERGDLPEPGQYKTDFSVFD